MTKNDVDTNDVFFIFQERMGAVFKNPQETPSHFVVFWVPFCTAIARILDFSGTVFERRSGLRSDRSSASTRRALGPGHPARGAQEASRPLLRRPKPFQAPSPGGPRTLEDARGVPKPLFSGAFVKSVPKLGQRPEQS